MAKKNADKGFKSQSSEELKGKLVEMKKELFSMRNEIQKTKKLEKPHLVRKTRKDIARVMTELRARELV